MAECGGAIAVALNAEGKVKSLGAEAEPEHGSEGRERWGRTPVLRCAAPEMKAVYDTMVGVGLGSEASAAAAGPGRSSLE